ncbi:unnamed protein product [Rotaria sordida]|uniref:Uncharacterized protein n=1 Tax=Rotaria sordida TaxID=392033 RepID=A0A814VBU7_9BILA|nr:unnamed protein product [Rotaria sordida]
MQFFQGIFMPKYDPTIKDVYKKTVEIDGRQYSLEILATTGTLKYITKKGVGLGVIFFDLVRQMNRATDNPYIRDRIEAPTAIRPGPTRPPPTNPTYSDTSSKSSKKKKEHKGNCILL